MRSAAAIDRHREHARQADRALVEAWQTVLRLRRGLDRSSPARAARLAAVAAERCDCAAAYCRQLITEIERNDP